MRRSEELDELVRQLCIAGIGEEERQKKDTNRIANPLFSITFERQTYEMPPCETASSCRDDEFEVL